jgi:hypothetical protein
MWVRSNYATSLGIYLVQRTGRIQNECEKKRPPEAQVAACVACRLGSESFQDGCGVAGDIGTVPNRRTLVDGTALCLPSGVWLELKMA